jgi:hypothetical protein
MFTFKNQALFGAAALVAAFTMQSALAGGPAHRMPADYGQPQPAYQLKLVAADAGKPLVLSFLDANGRPASGGEVAMVHPVNRGIKASPSIQYVPEVLARDTNGNFVCMGKHHSGDVVAFRGVGKAGTAPVWLTVTING